MAVQSLMIAQRVVAASGGGATFDPSKKGGGAVLSSSDSVLDHSGSPSFSAATALTVAGYTTGKHYFEFLVNLYGGGTTIFIGISRTGGSTDLNTDLGQEAGEYGWAATGASYFAGSFGAVSGATYGAGDVVGVAVDFGLRRLWIHVNGTYITGNPSTNTSPIVTYATGLGTMFAAASVTSTAERVTCRLPAAFGYSIPTGFTAG